MTVRGNLRRGRRSRAVTLVSSVALLVAAGCTASGESATEPPADRDGSVSGVDVAEDTPQVTITDNVQPRDVPIDTMLRVAAENGSLERVRVVGTSEDGKTRVAGEISEDGTEWTAAQRLEPGATYRITTVAVDDDEQTHRDKRQFRTQDLSLDQQTYPSIAPLDSETVGVGMPVIIRFDVPVSDRAAIERHLSVESTPTVQGAWHWYSDTEVHFRPRTYWKPGTDVTVHADINSVDAGNGVYGQLDRTIDFEIGRKVVTKVHVKQHRLDVFIGDKRVRRFPISAGKKGFETRSGTKVVMEKFEKKRMDAATTGISRDDPEYYNIADVKWAMRVTYSGEFIHGAPWSEGSQGDANVSHGCVGMSLENAKWLYDRSTRGDIVRVFGTDREIEPGNGWTDWDVPFSEYKKGSALG